MAIHVYWHLVVDGVREKEGVATIHSVVDGVHTNNLTKFIVYIAHNSNLNGLLKVTSSRTVL